MKRFLFMLIVCALGAAPALANDTGDGVSSHLGFWDPSAPRTTHQYWDFTNPDDGGMFWDYSFSPAEETTNAGTTNAFVNGILDNDVIYGDPDDDWEIEVLLEISNFQGGAMKYVAVDMGVVGAVDMDVLGVGPEDDYLVTDLGPSNLAPWNFSIVPNPDKEDIQILITCIGAGTSLDWIHVDTICGIPAPGAILLGCIGTGLVGWMRRRGTLAS